MQSKMYFLLNVRMFQPVMLVNSGVYNPLTTVNRGGPLLYQTCHHYITDSLLARWSWWTKRAITCNNYDPRWVVRTTEGTCQMRVETRKLGVLGMMVKDVEMVMFGWMEAESFYRIFTICFIYVLQDTCYYCRWWFQWVFLMFMPIWLGDAYHDEQMGTSFI